MPLVDALQAYLVHRIEREIGTDMDSANTEDFCPTSH